MTARDALAAMLAATLTMTASAQPFQGAADGHRDYDRVAFPYADAPIVARVRVQTIAALPGDDPVAGHARLYLTGKVEALIRGRGGLPPTIAWVADVPRDSRGRVPKLRRQSLLIAAQPVAGRTDAVQLRAGQAMRPATPAVEAQVRALVAEAIAPDAPARVTGVSRVFHQRGTVTGESETQFFLRADGARTASIAVVRRPGAAPDWSVSQGEIVNPDAVAPAAASLAAHRLRCGLPETLPDAALRGVEAADVPAVRADYAVVRAGLGRCLTD